MPTVATHSPLHLRSIGLHVAIHYEAPGPLYRVQQTEYVSERAASQVLHSLANLLAMVQPVPVFRLSAELVVIGHAVATHDGTRVTAVMSHGEHLTTLTFDCPDAETADALAIVLNTAGEQRVAERPYDLFVFQARLVDERVTWTRRPVLTTPPTPIEEPSDHAESTVAGA